MEEADQWNALRAANWHLFMPPARPSRDEVSHYERIALSERMNSSDIWCLLGVTPEIRSIASNYQKKLICVDKNRDVYTILQNMVEPTPREETFICQEWLAGEFPASIDIVFADGSINMLPTNKQKPLLRKTHDMLRPGGLALFRVHILTPPMLSTPQDVFEWYRTNFPHEPVFSSTRTQLDMLWVNNETLCLNFIDFHNKIKDLRDKHIITNKEFQGYNSLLTYNKIDLYYSRREQFEAWCNDLFSIENVLYGHDYPCSANHPIYVLRKVV
jgi:SAM-dependent methyltransferase